MAEANTNNPAEAKEDSTDEAIDSTIEAALESSADNSVGLNDAAPGGMSGLVPKLAIIIAIFRQKVSVDVNDFRLFRY